MIRTARLVLRPLRLDDARAVHEALGDAEVMRYWSTPPHRTFEETERWVQASLDGSIQLAVDLDGSFIGRVGFWRSEEIGFFFVRRAWGRGFAREALSASVAHAFRVTSWQEIRADVDPRNDASLRVLERVGFRRTGTAERTYCIAGAWSDSVYLHLRRPVGGAP
jgi:RimJ/RimL family protein N-acetyltransferase